MGAAQTLIPTTSRKPTAGFWITVALVAVVLAGYPLSFGPACWISSRAAWGDGFVDFLYQPILRQSCSEVELIRDSVRWYAALAAAPDWYIREECFSEDCFWQR